MGVIDGIILTVTAVLTVALLWRNREAGLLKQHLHTMHREMAAVDTMLEDLIPTDWQRSVQALLGNITETGLARGAALLALTDAGTLEIGAFASAPGESAWGHVNDSTAQKALEDKAPVSDSHGVLYLPLLEGKEVIGLLALQGASPDSSALGVAAKLGGLALSEIRLNRRQSLLSNTDGLTGLANHRHFQHMLSVALGQAYLEGEALAVILLDIDHFKQVNDTYGHLRGDLVLRDLGNALRRCLPPSAFSARYGGEEFVVLLQGDVARRAGQVAEEIRQAIEAQEVMDFTSGVRLKVTVSLGVALYELGQGKNRLIARADEALYASKRNGRNRVTLADASVTPELPQA